MDAAKGRRDRIYLASDGQRLMQTIAPCLSRELCKYVKTHKEEWRHTSDKRMREYLDWFQERGLLGIARQFGEIACLVSWRMFNDPSDYRKEFVYDPAGAYCQVRIYGSSAPVFVTIAYADLASRHSEDRIFLYHRDPGELGPPKVATAQQVKRGVIRMMRMNLIKQ
jgi:hypothetical protein